MFLAKNEIIKMLRKGKIKIEPLNLANIGECSVDLRLGNEFGLMDKGKRIEINENADFKKYSKVIKAKQIQLKPGDFILGLTKERITLPENILGLLAGRSRFARFGLLVHATAPLVNPGVCNKQVFEIKNISQNTLVLKSGTKIGQILFAQAKGRGKYKGRFARQEGI
ncbi:dCTP deaminase [archaeon]|nr:dCTP deaminase [archaeon]